MIIFDMGMFGDNHKMKGIIQSMADNGVDLVLFESAVKVGGHSKIDLNGDLSFDETLGRLAASDKAGMFQEVPYELMRIQQPVPEHLRDSESLYGTQIRKLLFADFNAGTEFNFQIDGKNANRDVLHKRYAELINEDILRSYEDLLNKFRSIKAIQEMLEEEIRGNSRYPTDLLNAVQMVPYDTEDGKTRYRLKLPPYDPTQSLRIQQLFNSVVKSKITKQKINGGNAVNVTQFGIDKDNQLQIVFGVNENGDRYIKHFEAYLPL
jgi:hypothetical protein